MAKDTTLKIGGESTYPRTFTRNVFTTGGTKTVEQLFTEINNSLNNIYTKEQVDNLIPKPTDLSGYYTKEETNNLISEIPTVDDIDLSNYYTKEEVNDLIPKPISLNNYYTKEETNELINNIDLSDYATKNEINNLFNNVIEIPTATEETPIFIQFNGSLYFKQAITIENTISYTYMKIQFNEPKLLISFTVNDKTFTAEQGMTWWKWMHSDYYDGSLFITVGQDGYIMSLTSSTSPMLLYLVNSTTAIKLNEVITNSGYIIAAPGSAASLE